VQRRSFITLLGGAAAAWPLVARAQQSGMPTIGILIGVSEREWTGRIAELHRGLSEVGFVESRNVAVEYRYADGQFDRLPGLAADLVDRRVSVIFAGGSNIGTLAAMRATNSIPIVFATGADPVAAGFVASLNRPGGNVNRDQYDGR
jgi:putative tryptophan/tyrosine transport system substrate-binding protein